MLSLLMEHHFFKLWFIQSVLSFVIYLIFNLILNACVVCIVCTYVCSYFHACVCGELKNDVIFSSLTLHFIFSGRSLFLNLKLAIQASLASQLAPRTLHLPYRQLLYLSIWCLKTQSQDPILVKHYLLHVFMFFSLNHLSRIAYDFYEATVIK